MASQDDIEEISKLVQEIEIRHLHRLPRSPSRATTEDMARCPSLLLPNHRVSTIALRMGVKLGQRQRKVERSYLFSPNATLHQPRISLRAPPILLCPFRSRTWPPTGVIWSHDQYGIRYRLLELGIQPFNAEFQSYDWASLLWCGRKAEDGSSRS